MTIENLANLKSTEFVHDANIYDFKMNNCQTIDSVFVFKGLASKMDFTGTNFYNCTMTSHDERLTFHDTKFSGLMMGCTFPDKTLFFNCQVDSHIVNTKFKDAVFQQTKGDMVLCEKTMSFSNNKISISSDSQLPNVRMLASEIEQVVSKNISKGMKM